jgi:hypothetical protein
MSSDLDPIDRMPSRAALARESLLFRMRMLSNLFFESDWVEDLEIDIWNMAHTKPFRFADQDVTPELAKYFRDLMKLGGGIWVWPEVVGKEGSEEIFITLDEWKNVLRKLKQQ